MSIYPNRPATFCATCPESRDATSFSRRRARRPFPDFPRPSLPLMQPSSRRGPKRRQRVAERPSPCSPGVFTISDAAASRHWPSSGLILSSSINCWRISLPKLAGVAGVYQRHSFSAEQARALDVWSAHVGRIGAEGTNVVLMRRGR